VVRDKSYYEVFLYREGDGAFGNKLGLPTNTARRILEDLTAYGLTERKPHSQGKPDNWARLAWEE
jgi:hypothetical protein